MSRWAWSGSMTLVMLLTGCGKSEDSGAIANCMDDAGVLQDTRNFSYTGTLTLPRLETASATGLEVCFDQVVKDLQCHDMDPVADIDNVGLVRFGSLTQEEIELGLSENNLQQSDMTGYLEVAPGDGTCINTADMSFFGTTVDIEEEYYEGGGSYMLLLTTGTNPGVGSRMLSFLTPTESSTTTRVDMPDGCDLLDFNADVAGAETTPICKDGPWIVDWSGITVDGQGNEADLNGIDSINIGFYEGLSVADLESQFLDLEQISSRWWTLATNGETSVDLADATDASGNFDGFDQGDGVWVLGLRCSLCYNPAPIFLTILEPQ